MSLLRPAWVELDSGELRLLLDRRIGGPGQYSNLDLKPDTIYLPLAGQSCRIAVTYNGQEITALEPGPAFDCAEWDRISAEIEHSIIDGPNRVGRDFSFSSFRVKGWWRGATSGVQILPPPEAAPRAAIEMAEHPFILEFPLRETSEWVVTNHRRQQTHLRLTLLLNLLLAGRTCVLPRRWKHFWAIVSTEGPDNIRWVQEFFFAPLGEAVSDTLSMPSGEPLVQVEPTEYYEHVAHDSQGLRVPSDLDESIQRYLHLSSDDRRRFDRALFWLDMASREWTVSASSSFAALVSAIESLTKRGSLHQFACPECGKPTQHETPGAVSRFKDFLDAYAPKDLSARPSELYSLRSGILHGSKLIQLDQGLAFGWDPPWWNESSLHRELSDITRFALRNWLRSRGEPPNSRELM